MICMKLSYNKVRSHAKKILRTDENPPMLASQYSPILSFSIACQMGHKVLNDDTATPKHQIS